MRKRNAMARELRLNPLYRSHRGKGLKDRLEREDRWSRAAKHKDRGHTERTPGSSRDPGDFFAASAHSAGPVLAPPGSFGIWFGHPYDRLQAQTP